MVSFPPCKVNLGLSVIQKRGDGFHDIETCLYPVPLTDILEIIPSTSADFTASGRSIPGALQDNLCLKAYELIAKDYKLPPARIHLHKIIPTGAGLGGGSSDAAHALRLLNNIFELHLTYGKLADYAAQLGSDCAFFLQDLPQIGKGRGEILGPSALPLKGKYFVLLNPGLHVSTADAYAGVTPSVPALPIQDILLKPVSSWKNLLLNDFEKTVFKKFPLIENLKEELYHAGAEYASMSGSGSSVYGIFKQEIPDFYLPIQPYMIWKGFL